MDRRLKIITIAISIVYMAIIGEYIRGEMADFQSGYRFAREKPEVGEARPFSSSGKFYLSLKPENGPRTFPTTMINQSDRKPMKAEIEKIVVEVTDVKDRLPRGTIAADVCMFLLAVFTLFVITLIPIQLFRVLRSISRGKIFDPTNIRKLRFIGYALLAFYIVNFFFNFFHYRIALHVVHIEGYSLKMNWGNTTLVILGFVVLMFAEVLKVSVQLKEEQALTI